MSGTLCGEPTDISASRNFFLNISFILSLRDTLLLSDLEFSGEFLPRYTLVAFYSCTHAVLDQIMPQFTSTTQLKRSSRDQEKVEGMKKKAAKQGKVVGFSKGKHYIRNEANRRRKR